MPDLTTCAIIAAIFLFAGTVKGIVGLGLPTISLGLLVAVIDLTTAMALIVVPSFVANVWQASSGGQARVLLRRLWPFLLAATVTVSVGAVALRRVDLDLLSGLLGLLLILYGGVSLAGVRPSVPSDRETWLGPLFGLANGIFTGLTGSFVVPGVMYLQAIGLTRDQLVQAMGMLFLLSTLALAAVLGSQRFLTAELALLSALAVAPALAGLSLGRRLRQRLSETAFRKLLFLAIALLGCYLAIDALLEAFA